MKKLIFFFLILAAPAWAQNVAVKFYSGAAGGPPAGWPSETRDMGASAEIPAGFSTNMTWVGYQSYRTAHQAEYDAWEAEHLAPVPEPQWGAFVKELMASAMCQRIMAASPSNAFATLTAGLGVHDPDSINAVLPAIVQIYEVTADERAEWNALVDEHHIPVNKL